MPRPEETVLVVEDNPAIRTGLELNLRHEGYQVLLADSGEKGLELARTAAPALIVLDLMLPGCSGLDVLRTLRDEGREMQIVILSALGREEDVVTGLRLGADDYMPKPFSVAELLARIEAALRRMRTKQARQADSQPPLTFGEVQIDRQRRLVERGGRAVKLTSREFDLLVVLAEQPERVFSREQLLERVWGIDYEGTSRTVDNFVRALRSKLEADPHRPAHICTVHGIGYRLVP